MAYGEKYKLEWRSPMREQLLYTVSISEQGYSGALKPIYATGDGITITQGGRDDSELTPIKASEATINFLALDNSTIYEELFSLDPMQYRVSIAETRGNITYTKWVGYLSTGSYSQPYAKPPYPITLKANDGIATLKSKMYSNADGTRYTSTRSVKSLIEHLLSPLGMGVRVWGFNSISPGDDSASALNKMYITDESVYMAFNYEIPSYYDVLSEVLATFGLQVFQSKGSWVVRSFAALAEPMRPSWWSPIYANFTSYGDTLPIDGTDGVGMSRTAELSLLPPLRRLDVDRDTSEGNVQLTSMKRASNWKLQSWEKKKRDSKYGVRLMLDTRKCLLPDTAPIGGLYMGYAAYALDSAVEKSNAVELTIDFDVRNLGYDRALNYFYLSIVAVPDGIDPLDWLSSSKNGNLTSALPSDVWVWNPEPKEDAEVGAWVLSKATSVLDILGYSTRVDLQAAKRPVSFYQEYSLTALPQDHVSVTFAGTPTNGSSEKYRLVVVIGPMKNLFNNNTLPAARQLVGAYEIINPQLSMSMNVGVVPAVEDHDVGISRFGIDDESYSQTFYEGDNQLVSSAIVLPSILDANDTPVKGFVNPSEGVTLVDIIGSKLRAMRSDISRQLDGEISIPAPIDLDVLWHDSEGRIYYTNYIRHLMKRGLYEVQLREMKPLSALPSFDLSSYGYTSGVVGLDTSLYFKTTINNYVYRLSAVDSTVQLVLQTSNDTILSKGNGCVCIIETDESSSSPVYKAYAYDDSGILLSKVDNILDAIRISNGDSEDYYDYQGALAQSALYDVSTQTWIAAGNKDNGSEYIVVLIDSAGGQIAEQTISGIVGRLSVMSNGFVIEVRTPSASSLWHSHAYQAELTPISVNGLATNEIIVAINDIYIVVQNAKTGMLSIYPRKDSKVTIDTSSPLYSITGRVVAINGALVLMKEAVTGAGIVYDGRVGEAYNIPNATVADTLALVGDSVLVINNGIVTRYRVFGTQVDSVATLLLASTGEAITDANGNVVMVKSTAASESSYTSKYTGPQIDELLGKAGTAYQKPSAGIPLSDLSQEVKDAISAGGSGGGGSLNRVDIAVDGSSEYYIQFTDEGIDDDGLQEYTVKVLTKDIDGTGDGVARTTDVRTYLTKRLSAKVL